jgi:hypothetical protein
LGSIIIGLLVRAIAKLFKSKATQSKHILSPIKYSEVCKFFNNIQREERKVMKLYSKLNAWFV